MKTKDFKRKIVRGAMMLFALVTTTQKPTMKVVQLQHQAQILVGSEPKTLSGSKGEDSKPDTWYELE